MGDIATPLDQLRIALGEVDVLTRLTEVLYDEADWTDPEPDAVEAIATLLGLIRKSADGSLDAFHRLHGAVADAAPVLAGAPAERWDYDKGTAPGPDAADQDAAIVRRIRELCPDARFEGNSDEQLIELFKRNRKVLARGDEDVIAAMTRPR